MPCFRFVTRPWNRLLVRACAGVSTTNSGVGGGVGSGHAVYETNRAVHEYLQFHYAKDSDLMPYGPDVAPTAALGFPRRCSELALKAPGRRRALDVGCAVGGMSFELARHFEHVVGIDFSQAFVNAAEHMKSKGSCDYTTKIEGDIEETRLAVVDSLVDRSRCSFEQGDACALNPSLGAFDAVLAVNLLCRLPDPTAFLNRCTSLVSPGGVLVLVSPYSWLPDYTAKEHWLGGREAGARSFQVVSGVLQSGGFELIERRDMPFLIRDHVRKFQWGCSDGTVWKRAG
mmetsp:Transcript_2200/g.5440  ORF Transcript_2200/g.5440 Transcript_2200/m.5440 type:complete len:286 (+) Transcript_2200:101-958(+)